MKIAVLGTSCLDRVIIPRLANRFDFSVTTQVTENVAFGGSMHNIAYHLGLLETNVCFYTKVGNDYLSQQLIKDLTSVNVQVNYQVVDGPCPIFTCLQDSSQKIYLSSVNENYFYSNYDRLRKEDFEDVTFGITDNNDAIFFQHLMAISPKTKWIMNARKIPFEWLSYLDGYVLNRDEALRYGYESVESFAKDCLSFGLNWLIVTLDKDGLMYFDSQQHLHFPSLVSGDGIALGCGDAFSAGLLYGRSLGLEVKDAIVYGLKASAHIFKQPTAISKSIGIIR